MKSKKALSVLLALLCALSLCVLPAFASSLGDVDGDSDVTAADARLALRAAVELETLNDEQKAAADIDLNLEITAADARMILRMAVGLPADGPDEPVEPVDPTPVDPPKPGELFPLPVNPGDPITPDRQLFNETLYNYAHQFNEYSAAQLTKSVAPVELAYRAISKWCCYYTLHDVFRPVLQKLGYTASQIDKIAPRRHEPAKVRKAIRKAADLDLPAIVVQMGNGLIDTYVPSLAADYYLNNPAYAETYTFLTYYDDIVADTVYHRSANAASYYPKVGDIIFMSNKERTYVNNLPTIDHTAQIIRVYEDGRFLCTEGAIVINGQPDDKPRVRERVYFFDRPSGTYFYERNYICKVLVIARPNLDVAP